MKEEKKNKNENWVKVLGFVFIIGFVLSNSHMKILESIGTFLYVIGVLILILFLQEKYMANKEKIMEAKSRFKERIKYWKERFSRRKKK